MTNEIASRAAAFILFARAYDIDDVTIIAVADELFDVERYDDPFKNALRRLGCEVVEHAHVNDEDDWTLFYTEVCALVNG